MSVKAAVVLLVVLVALFVATLALGASQEQGSPTDKNALVDRLGEIAGDPSAVPREDVDAGCIDDDDPNLLSFPGGALAGGCVVVVSSDDELKLLRLEALNPIRVRAPAPDGDVEVEDEVAAGTEVRVAVGEGVTEIDLTCLAAQCQVRLVT